MDCGLELPPLVVESVTSAAEDWQQTTAGTAGHAAGVVEIIEREGLEILWLVSVASIHWTSLVKPLLCMTGRRFSRFTYETDWESLGDHSFEVFFCPRLYSAVRKCAESQSRWSCAAEVQSSFLSFCPRWSNSMPAPACSWPNLG